MSNYVIFISYATADKKIFHIPELVVFLRTQPQIQEVLYWEQNSGTNIIKYMNDNIGRCDIMLAFCSSTALESDPVSKEWTAADCLNKLIVPIFHNIEDVPNLLRPRRGYKWNKAFIMTDAVIQSYFHQIYDIILQVINESTSLHNKTDQYLLNLGIDSKAEYELLRRTKARDLNTAKQVEEKGFTTMEEMLTAFKFGAFDKQAYDLVIHTLSPTYESALEVQKKGFPSYETMQKAEKNGFSTYTVMQEAEKKGFPNYGLMQEGKEKGFPTFELMQEGKEKDFSTFELMQKGKEKGFPTYTLMLEAEFKSFPNYAIMQEAKQKGFPNYITMQEAKEKGFFAYDLFQMAKRSGFPTYEAMQEGREKGFPTYALMQEGKEKDFPTFAIMQEAKEKGFPTNTWIQEAKRLGVPTFTHMLKAFDNNFTFNGTAILQGSEFILTPSKKDKVGTIWYSNRMYTDFITSFKIWVSGGDGIVFMFYMDKNYTPQVGGYLGFGNKGYGIEVDLLQNSQFDEKFTAPHIALIENTVANHLMVYEFKKNLQNQWHQIDVEIKNTQIRVYFDTRMVLQSIIQFNTTFGAIGFGAGCGALKGIQKVKDILIYPISSNDQ